MTDARARHCADVCLRIRLRQDQLLRPRCLDGALQQPPRPFRPLRAPAAFPLLEAQLREGGCHLVDVDACGTLRMCGKYQSINPGCEMVGTGY
eukprot:COSAG05_NODE_937_length_6525_cov_6.136632_6_plen_93_part_00